MKDFGSVKFEGKTYKLTDMPEASSRQLLDWQTEEGYAHFTAPAIDDEGNKYQAEWVLKLVYDNGEPIEDLTDSTLDWENADRVLAI